MIATFPNIREVLNTLHEKYYDRIELGRLIDEIGRMPFDECHQVDKLIDALVSSGYFELRNIATGERYAEVRIARERLDESCRRILFIKLKPKEPRIYAYLTSQYKGRIDKRRSKVGGAKKGPIYQRFLSIRMLLGWG